MTAADLIAFETRIKEKWERGELPCLLHLCGGNEDQLIEIFKEIRPIDYVFSTHRNHYHALLKGIPPAQLEAMIDEGRSMFVFSQEHRFFTSAILASTCGIAAGVAWDCAHSQVPTNIFPHVYCFLGDGAEEEGHFYEAALFAEAQALPITFIIEDNNRQVDTPKEARRGTNQNSRFPLAHFYCVERYFYTPTYPHAGSGCKTQIVFKPEAIARLRAET